MKTAVRRRCTLRVPRALTCNPALIKTALAPLHFLVAPARAVVDKRTVLKPTRRGKKTHIRSHMGGWRWSTVGKNIIVTHQFRKNKRKMNRQSARNAVVLKDLGHVSQTLSSYRLLQPGSKAYGLSSGTTSQLRIQHSNCSGRLNGPVMGSSAGCLLSPGRISTRAGDADPVRFVHWKPK